MADSLPSSWALARTPLVAGGHAIRRLRERLAHSPHRSEESWESEELFFDGDAFLAAQIARIDHAQVRLTLETYLIQPDEAGDRIEAALRRAASRGVRVRILVDGVGSAGWVRTRSRQLAQDQVEVRVYHPPPWMFLEAQRDCRPGHLACVWRWLNRRNHRKVLSVDGHEALVGSFNIDRRHCRSLVGEAAWKDVGAQVCGEGVLALEHAFERAWRHAWRIDARGSRPSPAQPIRSIRFRGSHLVRINYGLRLRARWRREMLARIGSAQTRVWITSAYFVPDHRLLAALATAAGNGADVRVLVPMRSDHWFMPLLTQAFYHNLISVGVQVHEYLPRMLHAKTMLVDAWTCVGSTNLNHRSLLHDLEADIVLGSRESRELLEQAFLEDLEQAQRFDQTDWNRRPRWRRWLSRIALLLQHWM